MFRESSGSYLSPVHHHLEACQPLLIIRRNLCERLCLRRRPSSACVCSLFSLRKSFFRSEHCVFVLTGFITDNMITCALHFFAYILLFTSSLWDLAVQSLFYFVSHFILPFLTDKHGLHYLRAEEQNAGILFKPKSCFLDQHLNSLCAM